MYIEKRVSVEAILFEDDNVQILKTSSAAKKAILYVAITPRAKENDDVIVNMTSTELKLGTGGMDIVTSVLGASPVNSQEPKGHIMKARYLPNQLSVIAVESQESPYHALFNKPFSLERKKVVIAELHSMIPVCFWCMDFLKKDSKMVVIISDEASLPISLSNHVRELSKDERFITITIGQAFGGTYEAINLPTALQFASEILKGDLIIVTLGPGVVGTGTTFGFSGIEQASWANIIGSLNGIPVWIPRISQQDERERHQGISHHTLTPLLKFTFVKSVVPIPELIGNIKEKVMLQIEEIKKKHDVYLLEQKPLEKLVSHCIKKSSLPIKTMGRQFDDDPSFFLAVAAVIKWVMNR